MHFGTEVVHFHHLVLNQWNGLTQGLRCISHTLRAGSSLTPLQHLAQASLCARCDRHTSVPARAGQRRCRRAPGGFPHGTRVAARSGC